MLVHQLASLPMRLAFRLEALTVTLGQLFRLSDEVVRFKLSTVLLRLEYLPVNFRDLVFRAPIPVADKLP